MALTAEQKNALRARLRQYYERALSQGQSSYFGVEDGRLVPTPIGRHWLNEHMRLIARMLDLRADSELVDVGCGEAYYTMPLAVKARRTVGLDGSGSALRLAASLRAYRPGKLALVNADVEALPLACDSFDRALCNHVLEHVIDDRAVVREIRRVMENGGVAVFGVPLKYTVQYRVLDAVISALRRVLKPGAERSPTVPPGELDAALVGRQGHIRHYSLASFLSLLSNEGFEVEQVKGIWIHDPRNWFVRHTQRWHLTYALGSAVSKLLPSMGAGVLVKARITK